MSRFQTFFKFLDQGVRLFRQKLDEAELSGVTVANPQAGVCVLINYDEDLYRQFFSTAHEYCHVLFDRHDIETKGCIVSYRYKKSELVEIRANAFAAEFLLPSGALSRYSRPKDLDTLSASITEIALDYRVNAETVAIRTKDVGWITDRTLKSFQGSRPVTIPRREKVDPDVPPGLTPTQRQRFDAAIREGVITL